MLWYWIRYTFCQRVFSIFSLSFIRSRLDVLYLYMAVFRYFVCHYDVHVHIHVCKAEPDHEKARREFWPREKICQFTVHCFPFGLVELFIVDRSIHILKLSQISIRKLRNKCWSICCHIDWDLCFINGDFTDFCIHAFALQSIQSEDKEANAKPGWRRWKLELDSD